MCKRRKVERISFNKACNSFLLYTPDKTVIVVAGSGDLFIFDELPNDPDANFRLRETKAHESDIVSICYSHKLGLIATADCTGLVCLWSYEFLSLETMIPKCTGTDIGQLSFIDPFPLLIVTDSIGNYTIIPCGSAAKYYKMKLWRVETVICSKKESLEIDARLGKRDLPIPASSNQPENNNETCNSTNASLLEADDVIDGEDTTLKSSVVVEEEEEEESSAFLNHKEMNDYLVDRREVKSIAVHIQSKSIIAKVRKRRSCS